MVAAPQAFSARGEMNDGNAVVEQEGKAKGKKIVSLQE